MFKPVSWFIGLRYVRARRRNHFISFISMASIIGIGLGVATLITVLSVMNGFEKSLRDRLLELTPHVTILRPRTGIEEWRPMLQRIAGVEGVTGVTPYVEGKGLVKNGAHVKGMDLRGILPTSGDARGQGGLAKWVEEGSLDALQAGSNRVILGRDLAQAVQVEPGDKVTLVSLRRGAGIGGFVSDLQRCTVAGLLDTGMYDIDSTRVLMHLEDAARLLHLGDAVSGLDVSLADPYLARTVALQLRNWLAGYWTSDWTWRHSNFFRALHSQKAMMFVIFSLIVAVAAFNVVSTLVMVVNDKRRDIAILRTQGMTPRRVMAIFLVQGAVIGLIGSLFGVLLGVTLAVNVHTLVPLLESLLNTHFMPGDVYPITELSGDVQWGDLGLIGLVTLCLTLLAALYPAWRAARTHPAQALRYE